MLPPLQNTEMPAWPDAWLIQLLLDRTVIQPQDLPVIISTALPTAWASCVGSGVVADEKVLAAVAARYTMPTADLVSIDREASSLLEEEFARRHRVAPLRLNGRVLEVATSDAASPSLQSEIAFTTGRRTRVFLASPARIDEVLDCVYSKQTAAKADDDVAPQNTGGADAADTMESEPTFVRLVDALIAQAVRDRASDVQFDADPLGLNVRFRVNGGLRDMQRLPPGVAPPLLSRLKAMAALDLSGGIAQDGRAEAVIDGKRIELLISTQPLLGRQESLVVRIVETCPR